ncbi:MAG: hypothetical protein BWY25_02413 [Chloroflexi bacterium ADurb.Bin222]|nr:MAG: hypothetical protein BWY25_02413 [Chloroflexi bacterium ADurb.Bin222]
MLFQLKRRICIAGIRQRQRCAIGKAQFDRDVNTIRRRVEQTGRKLKVLFHCAAIHHRHRRHVRAVTARHRRGEDLRAGRCEESVEGVVHGSVLRRRFGGRLTADGIDNGRAVEGQGREVGIVDVADDETAIRGGLAHGVAQHHIVHFPPPVPTGSVVVEADARLCGTGQQRRHILCERGRATLICRPGHDVHPGRAAIGTHVRRRDLTA